MEMRIKNHHLLWKLLYIFSVCKASSLAFSLISNIHTQYIFNVAEDCEERERSWECENLSRMNIA